MQIKLFKNIFLVLFLVFCFSFLLTNETKAIGFEPPPFNDLAYKGQYYNQSVSDSIIIPAGSSKEVIVRFKNAGTKTWLNAGDNYVSVYTVDSNYRESVFAGSDWISNSQVGKILQTTVPGEIAEVKINLHAPEKQGEYTEKFYFAAENKTWIKSTYFYLKIKVVEGKKKEVKVSSEFNEKEEVVTTAINDYKAQVIGYTSKTIKAETGGDKIKFKIKYKNTGSKLESYELYGKLQNTTESIIDDSWLGAEHILTKEVQVLSGKDTGWINFVMKAPSIVGTYKIDFNLGVDGVVISGSNAVINFKVLSDAPSDYIPASVIKKLTRELVEEPSIRVRLTSPTGPIKFKSVYEYQIFAGDVFKGDLPPNTIVDLKHYGAEDGVYSFKSKELSFSSKERIRFVPYNMDYYFNLPTLARTVTWKGSERFDTYRGVMEYVYSVKKDVMYIVNELPLSSYVAGIGEMSDSAPFEYMKTIMVAARSYAYYHINNGVPKDERTFDVYASTIDQLYLGYDHETMAPNAVMAQKETEGEMVTYLGNPVVTPYFGHSDGRTRSWSQVWGGQNKAWIVGVKTPYDTGKSMFGHGVGISMDDAAMHARKDDWDYEQILKYYYTGVEVDKIY